MHGHVALPHASYQITFNKNVGRASSYLDIEARIPEDSWEQSVPRRSCHCPYSTWMLAGSLLPSCSRENIQYYTVKSDRSMQTDGLKIDSSSMFSVGGLSAVTLPGIILDATHGQTEGHVPTQLFRGSHESLQIVLERVTQGGDWRVTHWQVLHSTFSFVSVVSDSQWSTGWSLGSSSTSHPPLSTLPEHL